MDLKRERRINEVLRRALELTPAERESWIESKCPDDPGLAAEIAEAITILESRTGPPDRELAAALRSQAVSLLKREDFAEAEGFFRRALETLREVEKHEPEISSRDRPDRLQDAEILALTLHNIGASLYFQRRHREAETFFREALELRDQHLDPGHPHIGRSLNALGAVQFGLGNFDEAEAYYGRALAFRERTLGDSHPSVAATLHNLAQIYQLTHRLEKTEETWLRTLAIQEQALGAGHPEVANTLFGLSWVARERRRFEQAETLLLRSISIREKAFGADSALVARTKTGLALIYFLTDRRPAAREMSLSVLSVYRRRPNEYSYDQAFPKTLWG